MELTEPKYTFIYMNEKDDMYWLVNLAGSLPDPCTNIGEDSAYMAVQISGAASVKSSDDCPLNSDPYHPTSFSTDFYSAKVVNDFKIYVYSTNDTTTDVGTAKIIHLTLKSKGWCDTAHQIPAKIDGDCSGGTSSSAQSSSVALPNDQSIVSSRRRGSKLIRSDHGHADLILCCAFVGNCTSCADFWIYCHWDYYCHDF